MAFDFPTNPLVGQIYTSPDNKTVYGWNGYAWLIGNVADSNAGPFLLRAGDSMSGYLSLHAVPFDVNHAATKGYVDAAVAGLVSTLKSGGG